MRVWRCFIRIVRSYLKLCILALSKLFFYGIFNNIIDVISAVTHIVEDNKIHCLVVLMLLMLLIVFIFCLEP
jgi:hypothetical protein